MASCLSAPKLAENKDILRFPIKQHKSQSAAFLASLINILENVMTLKRVENKLSGDACNCPTRMLWFICENIRTKCSFFSPPWGRRRSFFYVLS